MDFLVQPWQHQQKAIERARELDYFGLFFEQGTGKTATLINILREKFEKERGISDGKVDMPFRTLILCPPIVIENWKRELLKYSRVPEQRIIPVTGSFFLRMCATDTPQDAIYITNYHSLLMEKLYCRLLSFDFRAVVLDESHKIKTYNSKTTKRALALGARAKYRYCLSGTPILNTAFDIFPQIQFLDGGNRLGKKFIGFRSQFFHDFNQGMPRHCYFPNWKIKPDSVEKINRAIAAITARAEKKDCLDLPPLVRQRVDCHLTEEQERVYRKLEKEFVSELGSGQVVTDLEITKGIRLQQISSGYCPKDDSTVHKFLPNPRLGALRDLLEGIGSRHKTLIWACFRENFKDIELLADDLKLPFVSVYGGVNSEEQSRRCKRFEEDDSIRLLIGHPKSCGIGVNLTSASYAIYYSRSFSLEDDLQSEARNYRGGSERHSKITRIDLVAPNTIDEVVLKALEAKQSLSDAILKHYKKGNHATSNTIGQGT